MAIIGTLPDSLANGTEADASQVMANFNFIVNAVNVGALPVTPGSFTTNGNQVINGTVTINEQANGISTLVIDGQTDGNGANILLAGNGTTTPNKTIRAVSGSFEIANSAFTAAILSLDDSGDLSVAGNFTATGLISGSNITGTSDERLKKDWEPLATDFIENLASLKSGTYTRIDSGERQAGVSAQGLRKFLPESVVGEDILSVAYGHAALVACVELAKEVMRLRALLEAVK